MSPLYQVVKPIKLRHDELEDLAGDPILRGGGNFAADFVANRPAAGKPAGEDRFFYAEDEDKLYRDTGAAWQEIVQRQAATGRFRGVIATRSSVFSVANATETYIPWNAEIRDSDGFFDPAGATPTRLTIPAGLAGTYLLVTQAHFAPNATGYRRITRRRNGLDYGASTFPNNGGAQYMTVVGASIFPGLVAGDYLEVSAFQDSGAALDIYGTLTGTPAGAQASSFIQLVRIGD